MGVGCAAMHRLKIAFYISFTWNLIITVLFHQSKTGHKAIIVGPNESHKSEQSRSRKVGSGEHISLAMNNFENFLFFSHVLRLV